MGTEEVADPGCVPGTTYRPRLGSSRWASGDRSTQTLGACWGDEFMGSQRREGPLSKEENLLHLGILREQRGWRKWGHRGQ